MIGFVVGISASDQRVYTSKNQQTFCWESAPILGLFQAVSPSSREFGDPNFGFEQKRKNKSIHHIKKYQNSSVINWNLELFSYTIYGIYLPVVETITLRCPQTWPPISKLCPLMLKQLCQGGIYIYIYLRISIYLYLSIHLSIYLSNWP